MARKEQTARSTASKRKESPTKEVEESSKRAKVEDLEGKNVGNVVGGYKATLHNANASEEAKEHAKEMIEELEPMAIDQREAQHGTEGKNIGNVVGGYKATLHNANASEEAKEHAKEMIDKLEPEAEQNRKSHESLEGKNVGNVIGGYKATLSNENASEEAKEHAKKMIEELGGDVDERKDGHELSDGNTEGKNKNNVIGGFKATLHNPNVSDEAKEHAKEMIEELGGDVNEDRSVVHRKSYENEPDLQGKDLGHVIAGYKGTISNKNVSKEAKEHAQKMLDQLQPHHTEGRDISHVLGGYKATLSNPKTSDEARKHAQAMIDEIGKQYYNKHGKDISHYVSEYKEKSSRSDLSAKDREHYTKGHSHLASHHKEGRHLGNVIGGYKATLSNEKTSEEAKEHARRMLEELGADDYESSKHEKSLDADGKNINNVLGGYKATLKNPNVSEEAKEHAEKVLEENSASATTGRSSSSKPEHEKNPGNVIGGLKGALKNPNNSEEAKDEVRAKLEEAKVAF